MRTQLKRGCIWELEEGGLVSASDKYNSIVLDRVSQYSLLCFLIRVLRHRKTK